MKYLKTYKIFESVTTEEDEGIEEIISTVKDILLEVEDELYSTDVRVGNYPLEVEITSDGRNSFYRDISNVVNEIRTYIEDDSDLILSNVLVSVSDRTYGGTKIENLKGSKIISNCIDYFHSYASGVTERGRTQTHLH